MNIKVGCLIVGLSLCSAMVSADNVSTVNGLAEGVTSLDLFDATNGSYVKTLEAIDVNFPLAVLEDQEGGYVVMIDGKKVTIANSFVVTDKVFDVSGEPDCNNSLGNNSTASTRGITPKGC